jgi:preprotein translocase subunit SecE
LYGAPPLGGSGEVSKKGNGLKPALHTVERIFVFKNNLSLIITILIVLAAFFYLWYQGYLVKIRVYVAETQEELKKATWPSWDELKGSTVLVMVTMALLGLFTIATDFLLRMVNQVIF